MPASPKLRPDWIQLLIHLLQWGICLILLWAFWDSFFTLSSLLFLAGAVFAAPPVQQKMMRGRWNSILCLLSLLLFIGGRMILPQPLPIYSAQTTAPVQQAEQTSSPALSSPSQEIAPAAVKEYPGIELLSAFIAQAMAGQTPSIVPPSSQTEISEGDSPLVVGEFQAVQAPSVSAPEPSTEAENTGQGGNLQQEGNTISPTTIYVLNTNSMKFHYPGCRYASKINPENYQTCSSREEAIALGYSPCGVCNP